MNIIPAYDRTKEISTTSGTGPVTLAGPVFGYQSFASTVGVGNQTYYGIIDDYNGVWEIGIGTLTGATTLSRNQVLSSTNSNLLVNFSNKPKQVFINIPASRSTGITGFY